MKNFREKIIAFWFKCLGSLPKKNIVYFESFHGKQFSDNPKAIFDYLNENDPSLKLVWGATKGYEEIFQKENIPYVQRFSLRWFFVMPRAKYWVINTRTPLWLTKTEETTYIQTWHGTPLKRIGIDIEEVNIPGYTKESYDEEFLKETKRWDCLLSSSDYTTDIFKQSFGFCGNIIDKGFPRNDQLVFRDKKQLRINQMRTALGIKHHQKIVLYAPTWRETDAQSSEGYEFNIEFPYEEFVKQFNTDVVLLVRMHYLVSNDLDFSKYEGSIINVSEGYDMSDLLLIADCLITDYSSCMFDFSLTNRPMIFYVPDAKQYEEDIRGFYQPIDKMLPGPIVQSPNLLIEALKHFDREQYEEKYQEFKETFCNRETGYSANVVVEKIIYK